MNNCNKAEGDDKQIAGVCVCVSAHHQLVSVYGCGWERADNSPGMIDELHKVN